MKVRSPDYVECNEDEVLRDFRERIRHYEEAYETLDDALEKDFSFLKIFNAGEKVNSASKLMRSSISVVSLFRFLCTSTKATSRAASSTT